MIPDIKELNFPKKDGKQYATLTHASIPQADMGEKTITTQVKIDGEIVPDFSFDWEVAFQGEKYIMPLRIPQGAKENTSLNSTIDLTFQHWAIYQLKRWPFVTIQQIAAGTYLPDEEVATVQLNLGDFCELFGQVLEYYYGDTITIDLNPAWQYKQEATIITISHTKIWNVLIDTFHDKYGVRWEVKAASDNSNTVKGGERYVIRVGYPTTEVDHIFEYGFEGGLLKVERQVQSEGIRNMLKGRGGDANIPFRYFKNTDPNNPDFRPDPDWVEELANIYFPNLMPATFRSYVQGWKAAHISKYPGYTAVGENNAYAPWAYRKGYTDTKFSPVEFVADEITINPTEGDKQVEILPGYSPYVKKGSSIYKYGPLPDTLDNNEDIYPTLQGTGLDIAVDVEQIKSDDVADSTESDAQIEDKTYPDIVKRSVPQGHATAADASKRTYFTVPTGKKANIEGYAGAKAYNPQNHDEKSSLIAELDYTIKVFNATTGKQHSASGIPAGSWYFTVEYSFNNTSPDALNVTLSFNSVKITSATPDDKWRNTFDIWVKNIWDSARLSGETDAQYSERVWKPVLGDREGNAAKVVFTSGALVHEDYEFTIVGFPVPDTSKTWQEKNDSGVVITTHTSHWRITLAKSEAELEATGLYVPSTKKQGKAGDTFVFIGTEMTHVPYVVDAEERLDDWKKDQLGEVKEIKPTAVVTTDRVRLNNEGKPDALINQLRVGNSVRLFDKRFFNEEGKAYETLYLQSITYTYREPSSDDAALNPDVEIVLGNEYTTSANPVSMMQGEISALQRQVGSISNVEQIVRAVGDKLYLRKDGISDRSLSPTQFFSLLTSGDFRAGLIGGAGWGFYKDENGNWVLEADRVNVRQEMQVNTLVINQAEGRGGMEIDTAAYIDGVTRVVETDNGYVCYFDQKSGSVANLFHVDDVAFCNRWTPENADLKFYKRRVVAVGADSITLSKTDVNGTGIPAEGDNIIHFGNYTDATRQYVKVRDVVGGGYERYIEALNSVNAAGVEYYFIGKQAGESRWFVGNKDLVPYSGKGDGSYIEYINRKFNLHNVSLSVGTTIGDKTLNDYFTDLIPEIPEGYDDTAIWTEINKYKYLRNALLPENPTQITGGLIMSTLISLGYTDEAGLRHTLAGMNGSWVDTLGGRTIASWYGGDMVDLFDTNDNRISPVPANAAKSLLRMDGSAYFSGGNIGFRADGSGWLGNDTNGIKFGTDGSMVFGNGIKINLSSGEEGLAQTLESVVNLVNNLSTLLKPVDAQGNELQWSQAANAFALLAEVHFASKGDITACASGGLSGAAPATSLADLTDVELGSLMAGDTIKWDGQKWVNGSAPSGGLDESSLAAYLQQHNYVTEAALGHYVTVDTEQTITGKKTFGADETFFTRRATINGDFSGPENCPHIMWHVENQQYTKMLMDVYGNLHLLWGGDTDLNDYRGLTVSSIARYGGTSAQFLKADGSVDDTQYLYHRRTGDGFNIDTIDAVGGGLYEVPQAAGTVPFNKQYWQKVLDFGANDNGYRVQLNTPLTLNGSLYLRHKIGGAWNAWREILDSTNYPAYLDDRYVNKAGDTMTGPLGVYEIRLEYTNEINANGSGRLCFGWRNTPGGINLCNQNTPLTYGSAASTIWHAGNDGSGSTLDADLLDGCHNGDVTAKVLRINNVAGESSCFQFMQQASGWKAWESPDQNWRHVIKLNHGNGDTYYNRTLAFDFFSHRIYTGRMEGGTFMGWQTLAFTSDNVASATKLQTARSLWGQNFDGTANVDGSITLTTGDVTAYSHISRAAGGGVWNADWGRFTVFVQNNQNQTPLLLAARDGAGNAATGANRLFAMELLNNGAQLNFGFGGAAKFYFYSGGNFAAVGDSAAGSDIRLKSNIEPLTNRGLLKPKRFMKNGQWCLGFIAQEVLPDYPELIRDMGGEDHLLSLCYGNVTAVLAVHVNELFEWREDQKKINEDYGERIKRLEERL